MGDLNVTSVAFLTAGIVLLYGAFKNMYPQDVLRTAMGKDPIHGPIVGEWRAGKKLTPAALVPASSLSSPSGIVIATV